MQLPDWKRSHGRATLPERFAHFARWRVGHIAAGLLVGVILCGVGGPALLAFGLVSGQTDIALASLGMIGLGVMSFLFGPAVLIEWTATRGKPGWRR